MDLIEILKAKKKKLEERDEIEEEYEDALVDLTDDPTTTITIFNFENAEKFKSLGFEVISEQNKFGVKYWDISVPD